MDRQLDLYLLEYVLKMVTKLPILFCKGYSRLVAFTEKARCSL
jgi:hypothetical protein